MKSQTVGSFKPSVLIVDNDPLMVAMLTGVLSSRQYSVIKSYSGAEALKILKDRSVDLIICDVVMPSMTGYEFMEQVRQQPHGEKVPFVFMTSNNPAATIQQIEKHTKEEVVISKSVEPQELLSMVRQKLGDYARAEALTKRDFDAYRRRVVHTLSHEFRTPLTAINIGMELLMQHRDSLNSEKALGLLEAVRRGGLRLEKLVKDFLTLQQIEAGMTAEAFKTSAVTVAASGVLERFLTLKSAGYEESGISFKVIDGSRGAQVAVVEQHVVDFLDRLVSNADKFSSESREIELEVWTTETEVGFAIKDRGAGFDLEQLAHACEAFGQIDRERNEQQGSGLGLPIAFSYAKSHGGRIDFDTREGGGTVVTLVLPKAPGQVEICSASQIEH